MLPHFPGEHSRPSDLLASLPFPCVVPSMRRSALEAVWTVPQAVREVVGVGFPQSERPVLPVPPNWKKPSTSCCLLPWLYPPPSWERLSPCHPPFQQLVRSLVMRRRQTPESIVQVLAFLSSLK